MSKHFWSIDKYARMRSDDHSKNSSASQVSFDGTAKWGTISQKPLKVCIIESDTPSSSLQVILYDPDQIIVENIPLSQAEPMNHCLSLFSKNDLRVYGKYISEAGCIRRFQLRFKSAIDFDSFERVIGRWVHIAKVGIATESSFVVSSNTEPIISMQRSLPVVPNVIVNQSIESPQKSYDPSTITDDTLMKHFNMALRTDSFQEHFQGFNQKLQDLSRDTDHLLKKEFDFITKTDINVLE